MSVENTLRAIAFSEATTLGAGIALIAKHRNELDAALRADRLADAPIAAQGTATERALAKIAEIAEDAAVPHALDRLA